MFRKISPLLLLFTFFAILFVGVKNQSQSWYFQDETEHVTLGWMITDYDRQLYDDISTNHQPLPIFVGTLTKIIPYNTLFEFIDRMRIGMWLFALVSSIFIVIRFRLQGLITTILTYSLGHYFFSWHILAEPLIAPAVIWILLAILDKKRRLIDAIILGISSFWITFSLVPLWPFVLFANIYYLWNKKVCKKWVVLGFLIPTIILFSIINPLQWWQETIVNNVLFFIPFEADHDKWHYLRLILYPILHFTFLKTQIARFYVASSVLIISALLKFGKKISWNKKTVIKILPVLGLVFLLNPRISTPNAIFYQGFHLFPYVAGTSVLVGATFTSLLSQLSISKKRRVFTYGSYLFLGLLLLNNLSWTWEKRDKLTDYYIQYNTFQAYGTALATISKPGDTLLTGPNGSGYMNMMANLPLSGKQNFHLEWAYRVPYLHESWLEMIKNKPPTFIYFNLGNDSYSQILSPIIDLDYVDLKRTDGSLTQLRMKKTSLEKVTFEQWKEFENQAFLKPTSK